MDKVYPQSLSFLLCEDMRKEESGKITLIGVFPGKKISVPTGTEKARLNLVPIWIFEDGTGTFKTALELTGPEGFSPETRLFPNSTKHPTDPMIIAIFFKPTPPLPMGRYVFRLKLDEHIYAQEFEIIVDPKLRPMETNLPN